MNNDPAKANLNKKQTKSDDITLGVAVRKLPWLTPLAVFLWYALYGWGLAAINSPPVYWFGATGVAATLSIAMHTAFLLAVPITLITAWVIASPLLIDVLIVKGGDRLQQVANILTGGIALFALSFVLAAFWFAVLFWFKRQMERTDLSRTRSFGILTSISCLGLGFGWLIEQIIS
ncbi:hypothetical protein Pse7367_3126 [Thalassoporum mexicanum PCC 7367]|uniref:hypothetical protein n=1 Tax=Thalassoporum mexicanum TaxID=3457544 RepID=UPI00029FF1F6|nr:hypothetical protein [Pseudanabaena sp. PCC 7367]AFY71374.1 hypothetical protein Pse7367_3126 [Pseudanabaena sp. PCC 7367]